LARWDSNRKPLASVTHNCYAMWSTQFEWQTAPFIWIASWQTYP